MRLIFLLVGLVVVGIALDIIFPPSSGLPPALTSFKTLDHAPSHPGCPEAALSWMLLVCQLTCSFICSRRRPK